MARLVAADGDGEGFGSEVLSIGIETGANDCKGGERRRQRRERQTTAHDDRGEAEQAGEGEVAEALVALGGGKEKMDHAGARCAIANKTCDTPDPRSRPPVTVPVTHVTPMPSSLYIPFLLGGMILTVCAHSDPRPPTDPRVLPRAPATRSGASGRTPAASRTVQTRILPTMFSSSSLSGRPCRCSVRRLLPALLSL